MKRKLFLTNLVAAALALLISGLITSCDTGGSFGTEQRDCVVILGDSIWDLTGAEERHLRDFSGHKYKTYYMSGTQMAGGVNDIESQYDRAARQGKIRTIIMDGGGNDFLLGGSLVPQATVREINAAYERIFQKAARDGVENIVVQGYYDAPSADQWTEMSERQVEALCSTASQKYGLKVVYFDPSDDPWFASKRPAQYLLADNIHPTDAASKELARLVWENMRQNDIEQGEGCRGF